MAARLRLSDHETWIPLVDEIERRRVLEVEPLPEHFDYAWKYGGETAALHPGDRLTVQQLLALLLFRPRVPAASP